MDSTNSIPGATTATAPVSRQRMANATGKVLPDDGKKLPAAAAPEPTEARLEQAVQQIQSYLNDTQRQLQFQVDKGSGRTVVRVINPDTKELIRQIPSEEVLTLARSIGAQGGQVISQLV
ncbi:MAG: flagellar protein FlaG [Gammaproteobacteria bacterium]